MANAKYFKISVTSQIFGSVDRPRRDVWADVFWIVWDLPKPPKGYMFERQTPSLTCLPGDCDFSQNLSDFDPLLSEPLTFKMNSSIAEDIVIDSLPDLNAASYRAKAGSLHKNFLWGETLKANLKFPVCRLIGQVTETRYATKPQSR